eukprot:1823550-Pyramimonas_sp.AAC.1
MRTTSSRSGLPPRSSPPRGLKADTMWPRKIFQVSEEFHTAMVRVFCRSVIVIACICSLIRSRLTAGRSVAAHSFSAPPKRVLTLSDDFARFRTIDGTMINGKSLHCRCSIIWGN